MKQESSLQNIKLRYGIVGKSELLDKVLDTALQVANTDLSVLIMGESGVGKEVIPRIIHDNSSRKGKKYFAINCGSIPEGTIDAELFGHEKGAFTGAIGEREGYFGAANGGTLFLDEVGELPLSTQARLLRVLENGEYIRVGSNEVRKTDVRIVAATNVDMMKAVTKRTFREDLYYRLSAVPIRIPALRERKEDIPLLFRKFSFEMSERYHMPMVELTSEAMERLINYPWPGNIRQLRNVTEQISVISKERIITPEKLNAFVSDVSIGHEIATLEYGDKQQSSDPQYQTEREHIFLMLATLSQKMKDLGKRVDTLEKQLGYIPEQTTATTELLPVSTSLSMDAKEYLDAEEADAQEVTELSVEPVEEKTEKEAPVAKSATVSRKDIVAALRRCNGNKKAAALDLGVPERTLFRKIKIYGLDTADYE
jgi:DNA-binding NtrC family response regulator